MGEKLRCAGETARVRTGVTGDAAREVFAGDADRFGGRASREGLRAGFPDDVGVSGRCDDDDAEGIGRWVSDVLEGDRGCRGLVARGVVGVDGGAPCPSGKLLALAAALRELVPIPRGDGEPAYEKSGDLVASLDRRVGVSGGGERALASREEGEAGEEARTRE